MTGALATCNVVLIVAPTAPAHPTAEHCSDGQHLAHFMNWRGYATKIIRAPQQQTADGPNAAALASPSIFPAGTPPSTKQFPLRPQQQQQAIVPMGLPSDKIQNENENFPTMKKQKLTMSGHSVGTCGLSAEASQGMGGFDREAKVLKSRHNSSHHCVQHIADDVKTFFSATKKGSACCVVETPLAAHDKENIAVQLYEQLREIGLPGDCIYFVQGPACQPSTKECSIASGTVGCSKIVLPFEPFNTKVHPQAMPRTPASLEHQIVRHFAHIVGARPRHTIVLTRHGLSEDNVSGKLGGNSKLTPQGRAYAFLLNKFVATRVPLKDTVVWTSELTRTKMTAQPMKDAGYPIVEKKALNEIGAGICEGHTYEEVKAKYPEIHAARTLDKFGYRYPDGESYADLVARLEVIVHDLLAAEGPIVVVAHQAVLRCLLAFLTHRLPSDCVGLDVPSHTVYVCNPTPNGWDVNSTLLCDEHSKVPEGVGHAVGHSHGSSNNNNHAHHHHPSTPAAHDQTTENATETCGTTAGFGLVEMSAQHDTSKDGDAINHTDEGETNEAFSLPTCVVSCCGPNKARKSFHKRQQTSKAILMANMRGLMTGGSGVVAEAHVIVSPRAPLATQA